MQQERVPVESDNPVRPVEKGDWVDETFEIADDEHIERQISLVKAYVKSRGLRVNFSDEGEDDHILAGYLHYNSRDLRRLIKRVWGRPKTPQTPHEVQEQAMLRSKLEKFIEESDKPEAERAGDVLTYDEFDDLLLDPGPTVH